MISTAIPEKLQGHSSLFDDWSISRSRTDHGYFAGQTRQWRSLDDDTAPDRFKTSVGQRLQRPFQNGVAPARVANATPFFSTSVLQNLRQIFRAFALRQCRFRKPSSFQPVDVNFRKTQVEKAGHKSYCGCGKRSSAAAPK